jgi:hypothetical protein
VPLQTERDLNREKNFEPRNTRTTRKKHQSRSDRIGNNPALKLRPPFRACLKTPERGCVVLDQPQPAQKIRGLRVFSPCCGWFATQPRFIFRQALNRKPCERDENQALRRNFTGAKHFTRQVNESFFISRSAFVYFARFAVSTAEFGFNSQSFVKFA